VSFSEADRPVKTLKRFTELSPRQKPACFSIDPELVKARQLQERPCGAAGAAAR
jgi:hypothetical protein